MYFALQPHGQRTHGRWVGLSYEGLVITGWAGLARDADAAQGIIEQLIAEHGGSDGLAS